jgi:hypothetical protein
MGIAQMPGTNDLVVWERVGKNYQFDKAPGVATKTLILDLSAKVQEWGDCGLMAARFTRTSPRVVTTSLLYVRHAGHRPEALCHNRRQLRTA